MNHKYDQPKRKDMKHSESTDVLHSDSKNTEMMH